MLFEIKCLKNMAVKLGLYLENISQHKGEFEIIFPSQSVFLIEKVVGDE